MPEQLRYTNATVEGTRYKIPDAWLMGCCAAGRTINQAVQGWHNQAVCEARYKAQQSERAAMPIVGATLRHFSAAGPCLSYYGTVIRYTAKTVTYRTARGEIKRMGGYDWHSNGAKPVGTGLLHTAPCPSCRGTYND